MQPTLVLGASGFLGAHVVASAVSRARESATFANPDGDGVIAVSRHPELAPRFSSPRDAARWVARDLAPPGSVEALLGETRPARVVSCAALARAADCEERPDEARRLNAEVPAEIARWCAEHGARFVHVSTDLVFGAGEPPAGGFGEDDEPGPLMEYGRTKLAGERALLEAARDASPPALVVRLPLLYGNSAGRGLGASDSLLEAVDHDRLPTLFVDEWRTPLEVSNAADALVELAHRDEGGVLHVAGPDRVSRFELGIAVLVAAGLDPERAREEVCGVPAAEVPSVGVRPRDVSLASGRARRLLATQLLGVAAGTQRAMR